MIQISPRDKIFIAVKSVDFRIGVDSAIRIIKNLDQDPFIGAFFVFINKKKTSIKILAYDGQGMWLMQKRLSEGRFNWWPKNDGELATIDSKNFLLLLFNGDADSLKIQSNWREV